jgi:hypothetical protein
MGRVIAFGVDELQRMAGKLPRGRGCDFCATGEHAYRYPARDVCLSAAHLRQRPMATSFGRALGVVHQLLGSDRSK